MDKKLLGIYSKFNVTRIDGKDKPGEEHEGCQYFVLDLGCDPYAKRAILAYAMACEDEYPVLAKELRLKFGVETPGQRVYELVGLKGESLNTRVWTGIKRPEPKNWLITPEDDCYCIHDTLRELGSTEVKLVVTSHNKEFWLENTDENSMTLDAEYR